MALPVLLAAAPSYSQGFQDLRLRRILRELDLDTRPGTFVEFGWRGLYGANTHVLSSRGWSGVRFDGDRRDAKHNVTRAMVTTHSVVRLFERHGVPRDITYVSVDIDSADIWVLRALLRSSFAPTVLTVEYNSNYPWGVALAFPDLDAEPALSKKMWDKPCTKMWDGSCTKIWDGSCFMGSSATAIALAARELGYHVVDVEPGLDLFLVRASAWGARPVPDLEKIADWIYRPINLHYNAGKSMAAEHIAALVDYREY
eukprot:CAMPEP_0183339068 /NCGR_PEP_ID=MMETSP0164_2-20130417/6134_1 /TAXON_ID=221442 /ORGANISM="Coccolithus pelagicus ssp braarudi, Strain PLY182g" /LENGTH=256 /DNA_ID=CAMNT_0025509023 /DNA_START=24 /DNA_END=791 /DNA_ORIENTATION=-